MSDDQDKKKPPHDKIGTAPEMRRYEHLEEARRSREKSIPPPPPKKPPKEQQ
jgi:hypothetical protein